VANGNPAVVQGTARRVLSCWGCCVKRWLRAHSLSLTFLGLFATFIAITLITGPKEWREDRDLPADTPTNSDYWHWWIHDTTLSLEADLLGGFLLVLLSKGLYERHSAEAKDPPEDRSQ
jgi:hypothetical protein